MTTPVGVAAAIRAATWSDHEQAEGSDFLADLTAGRLGPEAYADLMAQQWGIYAMLESAARWWADDELVGPFLDPALDRRRACEQDLAWLLGPDWRSRVELLPPTRTYRDRIREVGETWAAGFLAHHYTRYLGDLSGGRAIGASVRRVLGLGDEGTAFYRFPAIPDGRAFKQAYRERLDATGWGGPDLEAVTEEVRRAYALNRSVLAGLAVRHPGAVGA